VVSGLILHSRLRRGEETATYATGGYFPTDVSFIGGASLKLRELTCLEGLSGMVYPVAASSFRMALIKGSAWNKLKGLDAARFPARHYDVDFCLRAADAGYHGLVTSKIRAVSAKAHQDFAFEDVFAEGHLAIQDLLPRLQSVTLLQEISA